MNNELEGFDNEETTTVSMETHIPESNIGYKLLEKMGWKRGRGLGSEGQGRIDPIRIELKDDSLGVGKAEEYLSNHISSTSKRKATEFEKQLEETVFQKKEREHHVEKKQAIAKEISEVIRAFYCQLCDKQYKKVSEYEQHLQSYDHHHKKRFKDMKEAAKNSSLNQSEREKKLARERKREEKELKRMQEALQKKMGHSVSNGPVSASSSSNTEGKGVSNSGSSSSGWATVQSVQSPTSGGWTSVQPVQSPTTGGWAPVPSAQSPSGGASVQSSNSSGGWTAVSSVQSSNSGGSLNQATSKSKQPIKQPQTITQLEQPHATTSESEPKKLSFGLKKTSFQFGLKKK